MSSDFQNSPSHKCVKNYWVLELAGNQADWGQQGRPGCQKRQHGLVLCRHQEDAKGF